MTTTEAPPVPHQTDENGAHSASDTFWLDLCRFGLPDAYTGEIDPHAERQRSVSHESKYADLPIFAGTPATFLDRAACRGLPPEMFFHSSRIVNRAAKAVCAGCPVRDECLEWALANNEEHGVFGGQGPKERKRILRERRNAA